MDVNGELIKQDLLCKQLDDDWRETIGDFPVPEELQNLSKHFTSLVKHLPEYRLFYATGLI